MEKFNSKLVLNAVVHGVVVAILGFLANATNIYTLDWSALLNVALLAAVGSLAKTLTTTADGRALGVIKVK